MEGMERKEGDPILLHNCSLRLSDKELDLIDGARGQVPREVWIRGAITKRLELKESPPAVYRKPRK